MGSTIEYEEFTKGVEVIDYGFTINPTARWKIYWDIWMVIILFFVLFTLPLRIALYKKDSVPWMVINYLIDLHFVADMVITFFTALPIPGEKEFVTNRKEIAINYLTGWFVIDLLSVLPFPQMVPGSHARYVRFAKLLRLLRLLRLLKLTRLVRDRARIRKLLEYAGLGLGFTKLLGVGVVLLFVTHILACFWISFVNLTKDEEADKRML